jgi:starch synthase
MAAKRKSPPTKLAASKSLKPAGAKKSEEKLKVLLVASEARPYAVTGGLADVVSALAKTLYKLNYDVRLAMPYYNQIQKAAGFPADVYRKALPVSFGNNSLAADVLTAKHPGGFPVYFIRQDKFYDRSNLYGTPEGDFPDNGDRFLYFAKSIFPLCESLKFKPDIIHCHDWQTALVPIYLKHVYRKKDFFQNTASVLTIHNLAYQGIFPEEIFRSMELPSELNSVKGLEFWGKINFLKGGIYSADTLNTVSPTYREEILHKEHGCGLEGVLWERKEDLYGILNGADYEEWSPENDKFIPSNYTEKNLKNKAICKKALLEKFGIKSGQQNQPVFGMVARMSEQKGMDIIAKAIQGLIAQKAIFLILGCGEEKYQDLMRSLAKKFPGKIGLKIGFDNSLAHLMKAGCDIFLIPSRYEPCGLNQFYCMKYGSVPVATATGGLQDSIEEYDPKKRRGTGFKFENYSPEEFLKTTEKAIKVYTDQDAWLHLQKNCMEQDFSWNEAIKKYIELYKLAKGKNKNAGSVE